MSEQITANKAGTGNLYVIAAPSGAGKTSLVKALLGDSKDIEVAVSYTTRPKREGEVDGLDYYFIDKNSFLDMVNKDQFLEYAQVFDNYYGTSREKVEQRLIKGKDIILEIDWQGARQVRKAFPPSSEQQCIGIFILPPSRPALEERLNARGQDSKEVIARRMQGAVEEISHFEEFDYLLVNDVFEEALADLKAILRVNQLVFGLQSKRIGGLITDLLA
jgi:guanylate kinase